MAKEFIYVPADHASSAGAYIKIDEISSVEERPGKAFIYTKNGLEVSTVLDASTVMELISARAPDASAQQEEPQCFVEKQMINGKIAEIKVKVTSETITSVLRYEYHGRSQSHIMATLRNPANNLSLIGSGLSSLPFNVDAIHDKRHKEIVEFVRAGNIG